MFLRSCIFSFMVFCISTEASDLHIDMMLAVASFENFTFYS